VAFLVSSFKFIRDECGFELGDNDWAHAKSGYMMVRSNVIKRNSLRILPSLLRAAKTWAASVVPGGKQNHEPQAETASD
jgi:hypothetical protein